MPGTEDLYKLIRRLIGRDSHLRILQCDLCEYLNVPLRTLQRWTAQLRQAGKIITHQAIDSRGYRCINIYELVDLGGPGEGKDVGSGFSKGFTYGRNTRSYSNPYGTKVQILKSPTKRTTGVEVKKITPLSAQPALFDLESLDDRHVRRDNTAERVSTTRPKGSPTSRAVTYWLAGRSSRPEPWQIAAVGKAMRRCSEHGVSERELRDAIDSLLMRGLDCSPRHYLAAFGIATKTPPKPRNYTENPTWRHHPKPSSMNADRSAALSPSRLTTALSDLPDTLPDVSTPVTIAHTVTPTNGHYHLGSPPLSIERIAEAPPTNAAEMHEYLEYQRGHSLDWRPPVMGGYDAVIRALRGGGRDGSPAGNDGGD